MFNKFIEDVYSQYHEMMVVGDFNIDTLRNKRNGLKAILSDVDFTQINNTATRVTNYSNARGRQAEPHTHIGKKSKPMNWFSHGYHG